MIDLTKSNLRKARAEDTPAISALSQSLGYASATDDQYANWLQVLLDDNTHEVWVYENENRILGWIHFFLAHRVASESFVEIGGIAVDPGARKQGIGSSLVTRAEERAKAQAVKLRVRCNSQRKESLQFYDSSGFTSSKQQHVFERTYSRQLV